MDIDDFVKADLDKLCDWCMDQDWFIHQVQAIFWRHPWLDQKQLIGYWFHEWYKLLPQVKEASDLRLIKEQLDDRCGVVCSLDEATMKDVLIASGIFQEDDQ